MKIFLDTANIDDIKTWSNTGIIDGVTTNPTHMSTAGGDPKSVINEIMKIMPNGEISIETTEKDPKAVYEQAKKIAGLGPNILVKIPCTREYYPIIGDLVKEGVKLNITLVFSLMQGLFMSKLGVTYISPFIGRLNDIDNDGLGLLYELKQMQEDYGFETGILAASLRTVDHLHGTIEAGVDVATLPVSILEKTTTHPLTDAGIAAFDTDWKKLGIKQFP